MPRDTSHVPHDLTVGEPLTGVDVSAPVQIKALTVGERLRAAREARGLTLDDLAEATKVRASLLGALEEGRMEALPSRPFAIGYVRAYAEALGLDPDNLVARFRSETPEPSETFRAPVGLSYETRARMPMIGGVAAAVAAAIVLYNVGQRVLAPEAAAPAAVPEAAEQWVMAAAPTGPVEIGPATPPPAEQTVPEPYVTPGLEEAYAAATGMVVPASNTGIPGVPGTAPVVTGPVAPPVTPIRETTFAPKGAVYGAEAPQRATVILQARKPASVIVRSGDGVVHFARVLAVGESYRAPGVAGLAVEVSNPGDFAVYRDGQLQGALTQPVTSLDKLAAASAPR